MYVERKTAAFIQNRLGPYEVGPYGLWQGFADILKLWQKQDIHLPIHTHHRLYRYIYIGAPLWAFIAVMVAFSVIPLWEGASIARVESAILFVFMALALKAFAVWTGGWSAQSKYAWYGAFRSVVQIISTEVPLGIALLCVVIATDTLSLHTLAEMQAPDAPNGFLSRYIPTWGGIMHWNIIHYPLLIPVMMIFLITSMSMAHRTPFDLPEAESELTAGYHTEYSGWRWSLFMLGEYGVLWILALLMSYIFLGAGHSPFFNIGTWKWGEYTSGTLWSAFWLISKSFVIVWIQIWIRWSLPRLRIDQWLKFFWAKLIPAALFWLLCMIGAKVIGAA